VLTSTAGEEEDEGEEESEEEGEGKGSRRRRSSPRSHASPPSHPASVIAVTAPHAFTADDVARIAAAAARCGGGCSSPAVVDAVALAASRLAEAALEAGDPRSLAAAAAAAADVGGASAHPACASLLSSAADALEAEAALFAGEGSGDALPTALRALVAGGLLETRVFRKAAEAAVARDASALSEMTDDGVVTLTRAFADARAHDSSLFEAVEREVLRRAQARGFSPELVVEILAAFNRSGFVSAPLADVADRAARALAEELEEERLGGGGGGSGGGGGTTAKISEVVNKGRARHSPASEDDMS